MPQAIEMVTLDFSNVATPSDIPSLTVSAIEEFFNTRTQEVHKIVLQYTKLHRFSEAHDFSDELERKIKEAITAALRITRTRNVTLTVDVES